MSLFNQVKKKSYVNKRTISQFVKPEKIPPDIEDEILEAFTNYSLEDDMRVENLKSYYSDLKIPKLFIIGNKRIDARHMIIEGTDIIDFDKLLVKSFQLIIFRNNKHIIQQNWDLLQNSLKEFGKTEKLNGLNYKNLKNISEDVKTGISDPILLDMVAVATDGEGVDVNFIDFAYILGKLGELSI
ncbi:unnamed protein product [Wickerhamomyces anomalus]